MLKPDYVVGLVDGEGSFSVFLRKPKKATWNTRVECHFYIKMREDDLPLLKKVQKFFGCGSIFFQKEYRRNQRDNFRYQISDRAALKNIIIPFFKTHPLQSKRIHDFKIFCEIVKLTLDGMHKTEAGIRHIAKLKAKMHA